MGPISTSLDAIEERAPRAKLRLSSDVKGSMAATLPVVVDLCNRCWPPGSKTRDDGPASRRSLRIHAATMS
jgi:hypothetical protein